MQKCWCCVYVYVPLILRVIFVLLWYHCLQHPWIHGLMETVVGLETLFKRRNECTEGGYYIEVLLLLVSVTRYDTGVKGMDDLVLLASSLYLVVLLIKSKIDSFHFTISNLLQPNGEHISLSRGNFTKESWSYSVLWKQEYHQWTPKSSLHYYRL